VTAVVTGLTATVVQPRPIGPLRTLRHGATLTWRSLVKIRHSPEQLLDLTLQPIIFVVMFVYLFGGAIGNGDRHEYLEYVIPGAMVQTVVFATMGTVVGDVVRYVISVAVVVGFGMLIGFRVRTDPLSALAAVALVMFFALALCWVTALLGMLAKTPQSVQGFGFVVMFPLTFGSNIFVPTPTLPGWLQAWVDVNPVSKLSEAARGLMLGGPVLAPTLVSLLSAGVIAVVFAPLAVGAYRRRTG
jgi:oleandomycin transport system permease protein